MKFDLKMKIALALAIGVLLVASVALAITMAVSITAPAASQVINSSSTAINATSDNLAKECKYQLNWYNGVKGSNITMTNVTPANMTWTATNSTMTTDGSYNVTVYCFDGTDWSASSNKAFTVETNYPIGVSANTLINNSYKKMPFWFNLTLNNTVRNIEAVIGNTSTGEIGDVLAMDNLTTANTSFSLNVSSMWGNSTYLEDAGKFNVTIYIWDKGSVGEATNYTYNFTIDRSNPMVQNISLNSMTDGMLNLTYRITDMSYDTCGARVYTLNWGGSYKDYNTSIARFNNTPGGEVTLCYVNITGVGLNEGEITVEPRGYDLAGNVNNTLNQTKWVFNKLYSTNGWNLLGAVANESTYVFAAKNTKIAKVSVFNNTDKTWTTFNKNFVSNNDTSINYSSAFFVSVADDAQLFRHIDSGGVNKNITVSFGWNLVGVQNTTYTILYNKAKENLFNFTQLVIKRISIFNASSSAPYVTYRVDYNTTGINTTVEMVRGTGYWLAANITHGFSNATTTTPGANGNMGASNATYITVKG